MRLINFLSFIFFLLGAGLFIVNNMNKSYMDRCNHAFDGVVDYRLMLGQLYCEIEYKGVNVIYPIEYGSKWKAKRDRRLKRDVYEQ